MHRIKRDEVFLERIRFVNAVRLWRSDTPPGPIVELVRSNRCSGRRQSKSPVEPLGKEQIACLMSDSFINRTPSTSTGSKGDGKVVSGCAAGCLELNATMVAASGSAKESSEQANLTAPLKSPS